MSRAGRRWDVPGVGAELDELARKQAEAAGVSIAEFVRRAVATAVAGSAPEPASFPPAVPDRVPDPEPASRVAAGVPEPLMAACLATLRHSKPPTTNDGRAILHHIASRSGTSADAVRRAALRAGLIVLHTRPELVRQLEPSAPVAGETRE